MTTEQMTCVCGGGVPYCFSVLFPADLQPASAASTTLYLSMVYGKNKYFVQYGLNRDFSFIRNKLVYLKITTWELFSPWSIFTWQMK